MTTKKQELGAAALDQVTGGRPAGYGYATQGDDQLSGQSYGEQMVGLGGNDQLYSAGGNDTVTGGTGTDRMDGGSGDDLMAGGAGTDVVSGSGGNDTVLWSPGEGNDVLNGGEGTDTLRLEMTGMTPQEVLAAMTLSPGSAMPQIVDGALVLTGVSGSLTIGSETITFSGFERLELSEQRMNLYGR
jgi:Ca2+-binding RTX toxin-like protein